MKCTYLELSPGVRAIVCGSRRYKPKKCACGSPASKLCDWILERDREPMFGISTTSLTTCDAPLCDKCTTSPAEGKDLCPAHAIAWRSCARDLGRLEVIEAVEPGSVQNWNSR